MRRPRFGEHRLTYEEWRVQLLHSLGYPTVMLFRPVEKRTSGPVPTMAARIATETREMLGIRSEVRNARIDCSACALHQRGETLTPLHFAKNLWQVNVRLRYY